VSTFLTQFAFVAARSIRRSSRQPGLVIPSLVFPLFLLAVNTPGLEQVTRLPGFPTDSYIDFAVVGCLIQGALFSTTAAGTELASDIETGFLNRLSLTPVRRWAILLGTLAGAITVGMISSIVFITVGLIFGVHIDAGVGGVPVLLLLAACVCAAFGSIGLVMALRTGSGQAVQGVFPLLFVLFFLSSINLPRPFIASEWFRTIATWNPISYMVEGLRSLIITGWDATALLRGFGMAAAIIALALWGAVVSMRTRMART
jgi:ABC-2 type transport system permease protein